VKDLPVFEPKQLKIEIDENVTKPKEEEYTDEDEVKSRQIMKRLPSPENAQGMKMNVVVFEKDDDKNFHIDFISAASNLRALNYSIAPVSRLESKLIAGKIIPAIVTTTSAIVGFVNLEMYKLHSDVPKKLEEFRNTFVNLALPVLQQSEPLKPPAKSYLDKNYTLWDRIDIRLGDCTLKEVIAYFEKEHHVVVDMIGVGSSLVYASWMLAKAKERLPQKLTAVVEEVTGQKLDPQQKFFMLDPTTQDLEGRDLEDFPSVCFWYKE